MSVERLELSTNGLKARKTGFTHFQLKACFFARIRWLIRLNKYVGNITFFRSTDPVKQSTLIKRVYQIFITLEKRYYYIGLL